MLFGTGTDGLTLTEKKEKHSDQEQAEPVGNEPRGHRRGASYFGGGEHA